MTESCVVVMPVYNEEGCIEQACREWLEVAERHGGWLVVVDDGSTDATAGILDRMAQENAAIRVVHQRNGGHGAAVLRGYREAVRSDCAWVFQTDSDRQFDAADFEKLWERRADAKFLLGCRVQRADTAVRGALSWLHRGLLALLFGVRLKDPNVPFRLIRAVLLERLLGYVPEGAFAPNVFLSVLASSRDGCVRELAVRHRPRLTGKVSLRSGRLLRVGGRCLAEMIRFRLGAWRRFRGSAAGAASAGSGSPGTS